MHSFKTTVLTSAVLLALTGGIAHAQSAADLKKEIEELRKQVEELKALVKPAATATTAANTTDASTVDEATLDAQTPATQADIKGVRADLENYKYDNARNLERKVPSTTRNTLIGGTVQARFSQQHPAVNAGSNSGNTSANTTVNAQPRNWSFEIPSVTLSITGNLFRDYEEGKNLTYALGFSAGSNFAGAPNSSSSANNTVGKASGNGSQLNVTNAFLAYSFLPTNAGLEDPKLTLTFGQQLIPFGLEAQATEEIRPVITSAQFLTSANGLSNLNTRQIGLILRGDAFTNVDYTSNYRSALVEYAVGVVNGNGSNKADDNSNKDFLGRLAFTVPADYNSWLRELKLGVSLYKGTINLVNTPNPNNATTVNTVVNTGRSDRTGFDINYTRLPYSVAYEYVEGRTATLTNAANATAATPVFDKKSRGQYVTFGYTWGEQFLNSSKQLGKYDDYWPKSYQAFVRFDTFDADTANDATLRAGSVGDKTRITTLGLNAFFAETTKFQLNYLIGRNDTPADGLYTLDRPRTYRGLQAQFQFGF